MNMENSTRSYQGLLDSNEHERTAVIRGTAESHQRHCTKGTRRRTRKVINQVWRVLTFRGGEVIVLEGRHEGALGLLHLDLDGGSHGAHRATPLWTTNTCAVPSSVHTPHDKKI